MSPETSFSFQGRMQVFNATYYDTAYSILYIKNEKIRIEEYNKEGMELNLYLINLKSQTIYALNSEKKYFKTIKTKPSGNDASDQFQIIKTQNFRYINGYHCILWRVKNISKNTEIAYWVAKDDFNFFSHLLKVFNKSEKIYDFFLRIPDNDGYMPMLIEERTLLRDIKAKTEIIKVEREKLDDSIFEIPHGFRAYH